MAVYSVEGKLGTGKTKFAVWQARNALLEGRRVAGNVDLDLAKLVPGLKRHYIRVPDKPTAFDLEAMGHGNPDTYDEDRNGVLLLDELGTWLNARSFQDPQRAKVLDWLIHARKHGWDVYLICQDAGMIDKQVREALIEYQCRCMQTGKIRIPVVGRILGAVGDLFGRKRWGYLPRGHIVTARVGFAPNQMVADRWLFRGDDLHAAYDTRQIFVSNYAHGSHVQWQAATPPAASWLSRLLATRVVHRPTPRPKLRAVQLAAALQRDEAWRWCQRYVAALSSRPAGA